MTLKHRLLVAALSAMGLSMTAFGEGRTLTVNPDASAGADYTTLKAAFAAAQDGDTIVCAEGVYDTGSLENGDTGHAVRRAFMSGLSDIRIVGAGRGKSIVEGAGTGVGSTGAVSGFQFQNCSNVEISGFTFRNCNGGGTDTDLARSQGGGILSSGCSNVVVVDCTFDTCRAVQGGAIAGFVTAANVVLGGDEGSITAVRCLFRNCSAKTAGHIAWNAKLYHCVVTGTLNANNVAVRGCTLVNCSFGNNRFHHFLEYSNAYNTLFAKSTYRLGSDSKHEVVYTCIESDKKSDAAVAQGDDKNLFEQNDTHYYNMLENDFRLVASSVAVGKGNAAYLDLIPEAYRLTDFCGNVIDTTGAINVGAAASAASVVTPSSHYVMLYPMAKDSQIVVNGVTNSFSSDYYSTTLIGLYFFSEYPSFNRVKVISESGYVDFLLQGDNADYIARYPETDGDYVFMAPPYAGGKGLILRHQNCPTTSELYVDAVSTAVTPDGTKGNEYPTIQAAVDSIAADAVGIIHVAAGSYLTGGAKLTDDDIESRVCLKGRKIRLLGAGAEETFIVGEADSGAAEGEFGCGDNAVRCVAANQIGQVRGFTLTGGRTAFGKDAERYQGAAIYAQAQLNIEECMVSNNVAGQMFILGKDENYRVALRRSRIIGNGTVKGYTWSKYTASASSLWANDFGDLERSISEHTGCVPGGYNGDHYAYFFDSTIYAPAYEDAAGKMEPQGYFGWPQTDPVKEKTQYRNTVIVGSRRTTSLVATGCVVETRIPGSTTETGFDASAVGAVGGKDVVRFADAENGDFRLRSDSVGIDTADWSDAAANAKGYIYLTASLDGVWPDLTGETAMSSGCYRKMVQVVQAAQGFTTDKAVLEEGETATLTFVGKYPIRNFTVNGEEVEREEGVYSFGYTRPVGSLGNTVSIAAVKDTDWYVDAANGSDDGHGTADAPLAKLSDACEGSVSGDTIHVAPGTYDDGEMVQTEAYWSAPGTYAVKARALVKSGVTLAASGTAAETLIVGASAPNGDANGLGAGAVRCVVMQAGSRLKGFTLTGGRTSTDYNDNGVGAGLLGTADATAEDCVFTNCVAYLAGGHYNGVFNRCKFVDCRATGNSAVGRNGYYRNCYFDHNRGQWTIEAARQLDSCTLGADNLNFTGTAYGNDVNRYAGTTIQNVLFLGNQIALDKADVAFRSCAFSTRRVVKYEAASTATWTFDENCKEYGAAAAALDADGRPIIGQNPVVDTGDSSIYDVATMGNLDCDGNPRFQNGCRLDVGCFEADWKPVYARALGHRVTVTAADPSVELVEGGVLLPATAKLSLSVDTPKGEGVCCKAQVADGELKVLKDGSVIRTVTAADPAAQVLPGEEGASAFDFAMGDVGSCVLSGFRRNLGVLLIVR